jgi:hypothetical protein
MQKALGLSIFNMNGKESWEITPPEGGIKVFDGSDGGNGNKHEATMARFDDEFYILFRASLGVHWHFGDKCNP